MCIRDRSEARQIELQPVADRVGGLDLVLIGPNDPEAMLRHTDECRTRGIPFAADPSQQLARMDGEPIKRLIEGAAYLFTNEYESHLITQKTGWTTEDILGHVGVQVTTLGGDGVRVRRRGAPELVVGVAKVRGKIADPTGVGDAFRGGFLSGIVAGLDHEHAAQVGAMLAVHVLETVGTQEYRLSQRRFMDRIAESYGEASAAAIAPRIRCRHP